MVNAPTSAGKANTIFVSRDMRVLDIILLCAQASDVMAEYGLHCFSCAMGGQESLEDGCRMHDFDDETIDALVDDLNDVIKEQPLRPQELTITDAAAQSLLTIAEKEKQTENYLVVNIDEHGGFCMEFQAEKADDDCLFANETTPELKFLVSPFTLFRIGGATIDFREDRFKLDLPDDACCGKDKGECGCG